MKLTSIGLSATLVFCSLVFYTPTFADDSAVVFMYHRFGEDGYPSTSIRVDQFRQQMTYLHDGGFRVIPLSELLLALNGGKPLPPKAVVITVDDAYRSIYEVAYPLLSEFDFPFTVFVSSDALDGELPAYLSWDQVREMAGNGVGFANHGAAHISMTKRLADETQKQWQQRIMADIKKGMKRLTDELSGSGQPVENVFAYPYGEYNTETAALLTGEGYIAFGQRSGAIGRFSDRRDLPRFPMTEAYAEMSGFRTKAMSLPLPVIGLTPWEPMTDNPQPSIALELADNDARLGELACYVGGQGRARVLWQEPGKRFSVTPSKNLGKGRQKVNCTAPGNDGRYLWFSHQWIVQ